MANAARLTVRECIATGLFDSFLLHQTPTSSQQEHIEAMLARFRLEDVANRDLNTLSQGQLRRVLLARALVKSPRLVLLDEAASGLDVFARHELFAALETLSQSGTSFVFASHRSEELPAWAARWKLEDGQLKRDSNGSDGQTVGATPVVAHAKPLLEGNHRGCPYENEPKPLFALQNVSVFLDGHAILRDLNWTWPRGTHWRVKGENGSGKSTFLRLLGADLVPARAVARSFV